MPFYPYAVLQNYGLGNRYHNAIRTFHAASTMPKYSNFRNDYARMASYRKPVPGSTSGNALAIRHLQRQVNRQKPETQYYFRESTLSIPHSSLKQSNINPCEALATESNRGDLILGDSWVNKSLELRVQSADSESGFPGRVRLVVYVPKKANTTISITSMTDCLDPNQMTVLHDEYVKPYHQGNTNPDATSGVTYCPPWMFVRRINLKNRISTFIGNTPEKNNIRIALLTEGNGSALLYNATWKFGYRLTYTNK